MNFVKEGMCINRFQIQMEANTISVESIYPLELNSPLTDSQDC